MNRVLVADIGNTRIKIGVAGGDQLLSTASLPPDDPPALEAQLRAWDVAPGAAWVIAGVHPPRRDRLRDSLENRGDSVRILYDYRDLPIRSSVRLPERVGIDRLLNAIAVRSMLREAVAAIVIDAGSAVTVDWIDAAGVFEGGAIFPGLTLMSQSLHDYTAQLPLVDLSGDMEPPLPGKDTSEAIRAGIYYTVCGGIDRIVERMSEHCGGARVFLAGGHTELLMDLRCRPQRLGAFVALEGIRQVAIGGS
jgi:type III pantothenate kinase